MKNIQLRQLRVFQAIIVTGTATGAADMLGITQPGISRALAALEAELGFDLFERRGRHLHPSKEGLIFYSHIRQLLSDLDELPDVVQDILTYRARPLRVAAIGPLLFSPLIPRSLKNLEDQHPELRFKVTWVDRMDIEEIVANQRFDIGLTLGPVENPALGKSDILTTDAVAVLPRGHPLAAHETVTIEDLRTRPVILPQGQTRLRQLLNNALLAATTPLDVRFETSTAVASCHMVANGLGVTISDPFSVAGVNPNEIHVRKWAPSTPMHYVVIWPLSRPLNTLSRQFLTTLRDNAKLIVAASCS